MLHINFYFQVHQPFRLRPYRVLDIGSDGEYFDEALNREIIDKVSEKCYLPANNLIRGLIRRYEGDFKVSFSITGTLIEQLRSWRQDVLESFRDLVRTGAVELMGETYYHSLASVFDEIEFIYQVKKHSELMGETFGFFPTTFRNTELIYCDRVSEMLAELPRFKVILTEGADKVLNWRAPLFAYKSMSKAHFLLMKYYHLSDDIAFRFSDRNWAEYPLKADKFYDWIRKLELTETGGKPMFLNLFMDYETFGEHQWASTGIFEFFSSLIERILQAKNLYFSWPSETPEMLSYEPEALSVPEPISWADTERDLSAWLSNPMQTNAMGTCFRVLNEAKALGRTQLLERIRKLTTSDLYYYMCTKYFQDGDVHKYFSPYSSPENAYVYLLNCLANVEKNMEENLDVS